MAVIDLETYLGLDSRPEGFDSIQGNLLPIANFSLQIKSSPVFSDRGCTCLCHRCHPAFSVNSA